MRPRSALVIALALGSIWAISAAGGSGSSDRGRAQADSLSSAGTPGPPVEGGGARGTKCATGTEPGYFVPGGDPALIVGCATLAVSGKPVEFSVDAERIGRRDHACINPAYKGRGAMGIYIPGVCTLDRSFPFDIKLAEQPTQGVKNYEYVIWGVANARTTRVRFQSLAGRSEAAMFEVPPKITDRLGIRSPFVVFVVELPLGAGCGVVEAIRSGPRGKKTDRVGPRRRVCKANAI